MKKKPAITESVAGTCPERTEKHRSIAEILTNSQKKGRLLGRPFSLAKTFSVLLVLLIFIVVSHFSI